MNTSNYGEKSLACGLFEELESILQGLFNMLSPQLNILMKCLNIEHAR